MASDAPPGIRGLFQQRVAGDDALLRLARLRFAQAGMPAELYANTPDDAERLLGFLPEHPTRPTVHLDRRLDLLDAAGRDAVLAFASRLGDRVAGLVVHDHRAMLGRAHELEAAMHEVSDRPDGPYVYLEYAFGAPLEWFADVARRAAGIERAGVCIDIGHVGLAEVRRRLGAVAAAAAGSALAEVVDQVQEAAGVALPAVLGLVREVGALGTAVHLHLHDGHPAIRGLSDHISFLNRIPVRFGFEGARSLPPLYGPAGLAAILAEVVRSCAPQRLSLTLEIHQAEGRLPLDEEAAELFGHWQDLTNAERLNYWLSVIAENHVLATALLTSSTGRAMIDAFGRRPG
jgi:hypothetical protein